MLFFALKVEVTGQNMQQSVTADTYKEVPMNIPRFTAGNSLYRSFRHYPSSRLFQLTGAIVPQLTCDLDCLKIMPERVP